MSSEEIKALRAKLRSLEAAEKKRRASLEKTKPKKPIKPHEPLKPTEMVKTTTVIAAYSNPARPSLQDIKNACPSYIGYDQIFICGEWCEDDWDRSGYYLCYDEMQPDPFYDQNLKAYERELEKYEKRYEQYEALLKKYERNLEKWEKENDL